MTLEVVVIGAGIAGLTAARHLASAGADVTIYEEQSEVGGRVRSRSVDGYTLDRGFQVLFTEYPTVKQELDLDSLDLRYFTPGAVLARPGKRSVLSDPLRDPMALLESATNREVTFFDKLRVMRLRWKLRNKTHETIFRGDDTTIENYLAKEGFSKKFINNFISPFYGGITLDRSLQTSKRVFEYTFRTLGQGEIAVPANGMGEISKQLKENAKRVGVNIETETEVTEIDSTEEDITVHTENDTISADIGVISTDAKAAKYLSGVETVPTAEKGVVTQYYAVNSSAAPEGKRLLLNIEGSSPSHVVPISSVAPEYSSGPKELIAAVYLGQRTKTALNNEELAEQTKQALADWYPSRNFADMETIATDRITFAQFQQPPNIHESLPDVDTPSGNCYFAGEFTEWSSIEGAMRSGMKAASVIQDNHLKGE